MSNRPPSDATVAGGPPTALGSTTRPSGGSTPELVVDSGTDRLLAHWESTGSPSALGDYLPDTDAIRRAALVELIKVDLDYRWLHTRQPKRIADYCREFPELLTEPLPAELVYEEYKVRRESGAAVEPDDYLAEFPQQASRFEALVDEDRRISDGALADVATAGLGAGQSLDDFDLVAELGRGAFARVFLARQRSMQRWVALKVSRNVGIEPQTLAQLDHPYIVRVFDQRTLDDRHLQVLFMEYVPGGTLLDVVRNVRDTASQNRSGRLLLDTIDQALAANAVMVAGDTSQQDEIAALPWPETVAWIGLRLAEALQYASDHGVLHRDIKPANVLLAIDGTPKLADFNVSSSDTVRAGGGARFIGGSMAYMSPEQLEVVDTDSSRTPGDLDTRSDIFALGVMLWELLTGSRPFVEPATTDGSPPSPAALLATRSRGIDPAHTLPGCPAALRRILVKSLEPRRDHRWSSGRKLARQFALCLDPHARELVYPPPDTWRSRLWRWSVPLVLLAIGVPNLVAAGYNYHFNQLLIVSRLDIPVQQHLQQVHLLVGVVAFGLGAALILYWCRCALTVPRGLNSGRTYSATVLQKARRAALGLGNRAVTVSFCLWLVAALVYPIALQIVAGGVPGGTYPRLTASLAVCGAVALAYPYFILTFFAVRCLFPILLSHGELRSEDGRRIRSLARTSTRYLALAAAVPLIGIAGLSFGGDATTSGVRVLCVVGIVAFIVIYQLFRRIEADLRALERVVRLEVPGAPTTPAQPRRAGPFRR
ncbi:serine/threonine-protein kinase [Rhodococcus sp. NPDC058521]|uniref:serine/threonine-protein kinase n=1 Tax=Rhodococcus sp. NPDC058521 TaxID=3346536 RepID=UPI00365D779A